MFRVYKYKSDFDGKLFLRAVFHVLSCGVFYFTVGYGFNIISGLTEAQLKDTSLMLLKHTSFYATNWNLLFQTMFLTMSLVYDILEWLDHHESSLGKKLKFCRDVFFSGLVVPLTLFISTMFWTVFWIDRELVFPKVYDQLVPWWFNHCVHTNITIVVLVETILQARRYPTHRKLELAINGTIGVVYAIVYYSIFFFANRWLYGVFAIMTWWQVCLYQLLIWGSTFVFYFIQFPINRLFHKEESPDQKNAIQEKTGIQNGAYTSESNNGIPESWLKQRSTNQTENSNF